MLGVLLAALVPSIAGANAGAPAPPAATPIATPAATLTRADAVAAQLEKEATYATLRPLPPGAPMPRETPEDALRRLRLEFQRQPPNLPALRQAIATVTTRWDPAAVFELVRAATAARDRRPWPLRAYRLSRDLKAAEGRLVQARLLPGLPGRALRNAAEQAVAKATEAQAAFQARTLAADLVPIWCRAALARLSRDPNEESRLMLGQLAAMTRHDARRRVLFFDVLRGLGDAWLQFHLDPRRLSVAAPAARILRRHLGRLAGQPLPKRARDAGAVQLPGKRIFEHLWELAQNEGLSAPDRAAALAALIDLVRRASYEAALQAPEAGARWQRDLIARLIDKRRLFTGRARDDWGRAVTLLLGGLPEATPRPATPAALASQWPALQKTLPLMPPAAWQRSAKGPRLTPGADDLDTIPPAANAPVLAGILRLPLSARRLRVVPVLAPAGLMRSAEPALIRQAERIPGVTMPWRSALDARGITRADVARAVFLAGVARLGSDARVDWIDQGANLLWNPEAAARADQLLWWKVPGNGELPKGLRSRILPEGPRGPRAPERGDRLVIEPKDPRWSWVMPVAMLEALLARGAPTPAKLALAPAALQEPVWHPDAVAGGPDTLWVAVGAGPNRGRSTDRVRALAQVRRWHRVRGVRLYVLWLGPMGAPTAPARAFYQAIASATGGRLLSFPPA